MNTKNLPETEGGTPAPAEEKPFAFDVPGHGLDESQWTNDPLSGNTGDDQ